MVKSIKYGLLGVLISLAACMQAEEQSYLCEFAVQAGCGYYVGDAVPYIFMHPREAYGAHFRYKFTSRWALQVKGLSQRIIGADYTIRGEKLDSEWQSQLINIDVMAEYNFFRLGSGKNYDRRIKPYSPYIFLGVNNSCWVVRRVYDNCRRALVYSTPYGINVE